MQLYLYCFQIACLVTYNKEKGGKMEGLLTY